MVFEKEQNAFFSYLGLKEIYAKAGMTWFFIVNIQKTTSSIE